MQGKKIIRIKWSNALLAVVSMWLIYSIVGLITGPEHMKKNGDICKGYKYGFKICAGNRVTE